ncbi:MAG: TatD family hydrolase, partial [Kiritimatiellae bacterium]|nr:TatD family hydrolase [Kiritimatiellia bacterium]
MTDAHCHVSCGDSSVRELLVGRDFFGVHPWDAVDVSFLPSLRAQLLANPAAGVGEIGLDRLKSRDISPRMREVFEAQLALALELGRPVVLHGAKCWGQVVTTVCRHLSHSPTPPLPH